MSLKNWFFIIMSSKITHLVSLESKNVKNHHIRIFDVIFYHDSLSAPTLFFFFTFKMLQKLGKNKKKINFRLSRPSKSKKTVFDFFDEKKFFFREKNFFLVSFLFWILLNALYEIWSLCLILSRNYEILKFSKISFKNRVRPDTLDAIFFSSWDSSNLTSKLNSAGSI